DRAAHPRPHGRGLRHAVRHHGPGRDDPDLPVADPRPLLGDAAQGRLAGGARVVRSHHRVRVLRPAGAALPRHLPRRAQGRRRAAAAPGRARAAHRQGRDADGQHRRQRLPRPARHPAAGRTRRDRGDDGLLAAGRVRAGLRCGRARGGARPRRPVAGDALLAADPPAAPGERGRAAHPDRGPAALGDRGAARRGLGPLVRQRRRL
ncbi:MAG: MarC family integral membrane protein, partial [uncultured Nocardioidaceae bacterium]